MIACEDVKVCLYASFKEMYKFHLKRGAVLHARNGDFLADKIIGLPYGARIFAERKKPVFMTLMPLSPELHTCCIDYQTQIVYAADLAMATMWLNCESGSVLIEAGSGSGSATVSFARSVGTSGHVFSMEVNDQRHSLMIDLQAELKLSNVTCLRRDVYEKGLLPEGKKPHFADGIFLDLPEPWRMLAHCDEALKPTGVLVAFSPCIEQVQETQLSMKQHGYQQVQCVEVIMRGWGVVSTEDNIVKRERIAMSSCDSNRATLQHLDSPVFNHSCNKIYPQESFGHTGYLLMGVRPPCDESEVEFSIMDTYSRVRI